MLDLFAPLSPAARSDNRRAYRAFLADRDGTVDAERRTLSRREELMERHIRPPAKLRAIDAELFERQYRSFDRSLETSDEMLLLLLMVKMNAAEAYGVNRSFDKAFKRAVADKDDLELVLLLEEGYHTRILLSTSTLYGVNVSTPYSPAAALRALIAGVAEMPQFVARPLLLASELLGVLSFMGMLQLVGHVFKEDPELRDGFEERICEILVDEIGHVSFNRTCLGAAGLAQARVMLPLVATGVRNAIPEHTVLTQRLDFKATMDPGAVVGPRSVLPESVKRQAFLA
jgi:hypothetical protein